MKTIKILLTLFFLGTVTHLQAQQTALKAEANVNAYAEKMSYYEKRGAEDAQFELTFVAKTKAEEKAFWKEQKAYEKQLKAKNRKAYRAYIASKKEVYAEHYNHCDAHCHHDAGFYTYAGYYYYGYDNPRYQRSYAPSSVNTRISVGTPSLRLGL